MAERFLNTIGGETCAALSGDWIESVNPYDGKPWAEIPRCGADDADKAVRAAHSAFTSGEWPALTPDHALRSSIRCRLHSCSTPSPGKSHRVPIPCRMV